MSDKQLTSQVAKNVDSRSATRYGLVPYQRPLLALGERLNVRIDQEDLKVVAFLCEDRNGDSGTRRTPVATGFFVNVPCQSDPNVSWDYLVTARHVIGMSEKDTLFVRIRTTGQNGFRDIPTDRKQWHAHEEADVAAILWAFPDFDHEESLEFTYIPLRLFVGPGPNYRFGEADLGSLPHRAIEAVMAVAPAEGEQVGVGDEVFAVGLFTQKPRRREDFARGQVRPHLSNARPGQHRNWPWCGRICRATRCRRLPGGIPFVGWDEWLPRVLASPDALASPPRFFAGTPEGFFGSRLGALLHPAEGR